MGYMGTCPSLVELSTKMKISIGPIRETTLQSHSFFINGFCKAEKVFFKSNLFKINEKEKYTDTLVYLLRHINLQY